MMQATLKTFRVGGETEYSDSPEYADVCGVLLKKRLSALVERMYATGKDNGFVKHYIQSQVITGSRCQFRQKSESNIRTYMHVKFVLGWSTIEERILTHPTMTRLCIAVH